MPKQLRTQPTRCKPKKIAWWPLSPTLLLLSACVARPMVVADCAPPPPLPPSLAKLPPPEGTAQACLTELSQGQTSGPSCNLLRLWLID